jgi:tRNA (guanosine-2'-O-)-methyltransferase
MTQAKIRPKTKDELKQQRRRVSHSCWGYAPGGIVCAVPHPLHGVNLGTLLRTCEAVGACLAVPHYPWVPQALSKGYTISQRGCVHWMRPSAMKWMERERERGKDNPDEYVNIIGVELADEAVRLADLPVRGKRRSIVVMGHEKEGIPAAMLPLLDTAVEIPMVGAGTTLNMAVAGSLVLYKLAGLV